MPNRDAQVHDERTICVEFELTPEEWVEVSLDHAARSPLVSAAVRNVRVIFVLIVALLALLSLVQGSGFAAMVWLFLGAFGFAALGPALERGRRQQYVKYAETGIANGMFGRHRVTIGPEGMRDATELYEWLTRWPAIERVEEGSGAFLIYTGPNALQPIPHSAFPDAESLRRFSDGFYALRAAGTADRLPEG
jgi:hypothetical protein